MIKYKIETFDDLVKILKTHVIKNKMLNYIHIEYNDFYNVIESKNIVNILKLMKKLNVKLFIEE